jgi:adenosylhomocysteine nucleosidase
MMHRLHPVLAILLILLGAAPARAAPRSGKLNPIPRIAVISAFAPELIELRAAVAHPRALRVNGVNFTLGTIGGKPVVVFESGMSLVNAAMNTQLALDRFRVTRIVFSGVAGAADPDLRLGDVVIPERWAQYLEASFARTDGTAFAPPRFDDGPALANYDMIFPHAVEVRRAGDDKPERKLWFAADPAMLATAKTAVAALSLDRCFGAVCLLSKPRVKLGGSGVSGTVFMDNAAFRAYLAKTFEAEAIDMETAGVAQVAYANRTPFLGVRAMSDLAGADPGGNPVFRYLGVAAHNSAKTVLAFLKASPGV